MKMKVIERPHITLYEFLEIVLMWHCSGNIPMDWRSTCAFIEDEHFAEFSMSVQHWCGVLGVAVPERSDIVKTLHQLYNDPALLNG